MVIEFFNIHYFIYLGLGALFTFYCVMIVKNRPKKFQFWFIYALIISALILHFAKQFFPYYQEWYPRSLRKSTFENICAANTLLFPILYFTKKRLWKDYMIVIGMISGILAFILPIEVLDDYPYALDVFRYYYAHLILFIAPFLMLYTKQYRFNYRSAFKVPLMFYLVLCLILVNEVILYATDMIEFDIRKMFDPSYRNFAFIFGPMRYFGMVEDYIMALVPKVFTTIPVGQNAGETMYWPIIWMIIPSYVYVTIAGLIIGISVDFKQIKSDFKKLFHIH